MWSCTYKYLSKAAQVMERVNLLIRTAALLTDHHHPVFLSFVSVPRGIA